MIPRSLKLVEKFWFYGHFSKHSHCQFSLHSRDISVRDNGFSDFLTLLPGSLLIHANKTKLESLWTAIPAMNSWRRFNKLCKWLCFKKWLLNQYYQTKSNDLGTCIILFRRQCFYLMASKNYRDFRIWKYLMKIKHSIVLGHPVLQYWYKVANTTVNLLFCCQYYMYFITISDSVKWVFYFFIYYTSLHPSLIYI